jgi:hypothetical protein
VNKRLAARKAKNFITLGHGHDIATAPIVGRKSAAPSANFGIKSRKFNFLTTLD